MTPAQLDDLGLFEGLEPASKSALAQALRERSLVAGEPLFAQGDRAHSCFVVLDGQIVVDTEIEGLGRERLSVLGRGDLFGEVALLDGGDRSATCTAGPDGAHVAELVRADFDRLFNAGDALAYGLMDTLLDRLAARLRGATRRLLEVAAE